MTVKNLITELLNMPMDARVQIVYADKDGDYIYEDIVAPVYYDDENEVGIVGKYDRTV